MCVLLPLCLAKQTRHLSISFYHLLLVPDPEPTPVWITFSIAHFSVKVTYTPDEVWDCLLLCRFHTLSVQGNGGLIFTPLLTHPSPHLPSHTIISAISPHPSHPFHLFIATSRELLLLDTRQPDPPLLATQHEFHDPPRFISTLCNDEGDSILVCQSQAFLMANNHRFLC